MATQKRASVLVADAEPVARSGLVHLINSHPALRVCAEAETLEAARDLCAREHPQIAVLDPAMGDGMAFIRDLPRWSRGTRVVVFTTRSDALGVQRALRAGACGYVTRRDPVAALMVAVLGALEGERHVSPRVEHVLLENLARGTMEMEGDDLAALSNRERQVFFLFGRGLGTRAVAEELHLSTKTVETHRERIKEKLGVRSAGELQRRAVLAEQDQSEPIGGETAARKTHTPKSRPLEKANRAATQKLRGSLTQQHKHRYKR